MAHRGRRPDRQPAASTDDFRRQQRDVYIPPGEPGYWQGAIRNRSDPAYDEIHSALRGGARISVDLIYGDYEGGQRTIARIGLTRDGADDRDDYLAEVGRYWNVDGVDPRERPEAPPELSPRWRSRVPISARPGRGIESLDG